MSNQETLRILIADDDRSVRKTLALILQAEGYAVDTAENGERARALILAADYHAMLLDLRLPDARGVDLLEHARARGRDPLAIIITAFGTIESAVDAVKAGAYHYVTKPVDIDNLKLLLRQGLENRRLARENRELKKRLSEKASFGSIIGRSRAMQDVFELGRLAARADSSVLILGETGTGKELVADAIHAHSPRAHAPFEKINCAALPETLLESELFGHEKGAFTDARDLKRGLFERAHGGVILFDEIGCMTPATQARLLRVLQDRRVRRLGGETDFGVDVRIIASTNERITEAMAQGRFRQDLYYRLNVVEIKLPPLRERMDDVPLLVRYFIARHAPGRDVTVDPAAMDLLMGHAWPGNVRELENVIERAFLFDLDGRIEPRHLPKLTISNAPVAPDAPAPGATFDDFSRGLVRRTVDQAGGNKTRAAEILGVSRNFIRRHLQEPEEQP